MSAESLRRARFFRQAGYLRVLGVLSPAETAELRSFVLEENTKENGTATHQLGRTATKLYGLYDRRPQLMHRLVTHPRLVSELTPILGPNIIFVKNRHNHASVNDHTENPEAAALHRDVLQPTRGLLTAAVYLEASTTLNGCTHIIPTSQTLDYVGVPQVNGGGTWMANHEEYQGLLDQALPVPMPEGSVLLFDGLAFHSIGQNNTSSSRMSMTLGFRSVDELSAQPDNTREIIISGQYLYRGNDQ